MMKPAHQPVQVLVIQLSSLGETLQSLMALRAAQQLYPCLEITLVTRDDVAEAAKRVPWLKQVHALSAADMLSGGKKELARWLSPLQSASWDFVVNWSFSESSSFLAGLVPGRVKLGFTRRRDLTLSAPDGWSHYIQAVVQGGVDQNIHLTDILTTQLLTALQIHLGDPADAGNAPVTSKGFFALNMNLDPVMGQVRDLSRKWIGLQIDSRHATHGWDTENWAELAVYLLNRHPECGIVLLGDKASPSCNADTVIGYVSDLVPHHAKRVVNTVGRTDFDSWAALIGRCQWVITAESAAVHLASILGTRVLGISVGGTRSSETGPYGNGHYLVQSASKDTVTSEAVYAAWAYASSEWSHRRQTRIEQHFERLGFERDLEKLDILRSKIRGTTEGGGVAYESILDRPMELTDWNSQVMGHIARAWYCGWLPPIGHELDRTKISARMIQELRQIDEAGDVLFKVCEEAKRTALTLQSRSSTLKSDRIMPLRAREELQDLGRKLAELDKLIDRLATAQKPLLGFAQMAKVLMHNLKGNLLTDLGRESAESYAQIGHGVMILRDWAKHTLKMTRPVAVVASPTRETSA